MKSERKQIQESNLLADKIEQLAIQLKQALPVILAVTAVALIGILSYGFYASMKEKESAKGWTALYFAGTDEADLNVISTDFGSTSAGLWAKQTIGDAYMSRASEVVFVDRDLAEQFYKQAVEEYRDVTEKSSEPFLKCRAFYGLAQASEGMGDSAQAILYYRKATLGAGLTPEFVAECNKRAAWLESKAAEEFYAWYRTNRASARGLDSSQPTKQALPATPDFAFPTKPADLPADKPAVVPADMPAVVPADKPVDVPSDKPLDTPSDKPNE